MKPFQFVFVYALLCVILNNPITVFGQNGWMDNFENYAAGSWPSTWVPDGNAYQTSSNYIDHSVSYEGNKSIRLYGSVGSCWGALGYRPISIAAPFEYEVAVRNGNEMLSGCHPDRGDISLRMGTHWSNPARCFVTFKGNGTILSGGGTVSLGNYSTLTWYKVKVRYERLDNSLVKLSYWINGIYKGSETFTAISNEANLNNVQITSQEGTVWYDNVSVRPVFDAFQVSIFRSPDSRIFGSNSNQPLPELHNSTSGIDHRLCADGSKATLVRIRNLDLSQFDTELITLRMRDDPTGSYPDIYGIFNNDDKNLVNSSTIEWTYTHPTFLSQPLTTERYRDELVDVVYDGDILQTLKFRFITPPVLMVHGLWGDTSTWNPLENQLETVYLSDDQSTSHINYLLTKKVDYSVEQRASASFKINAKYIERSIINMLEVLATQGIACGKVDIIGHSMGGLVSRYWMRETSGNKNYVRKLITANSPHSGSQAANFLRSNYRGAFEARTLIWISMGSTSAGAVDDLKVGISNNGTGELMSSNFLARQRVPSHAIYTKRVLDFESDYISIDNMNILTNADEITLLNIVGTARFSSWQNMQIASIPVHLQPTLIKQFLTIVVPDYLNDVFNGDPSDIIVPINSQKGGLSSGRISFVDSLKHMGSVRNQNVIDTIVSLLKENPNNSLVFAQGFNPPALSFAMTDKQVEVKGLENDSVRIYQPLENSVVTPGDTIDIIASGSTGIQMIMLFVGNENCGYNYQQSYGDSALFKFLVPDFCPNGLLIRVVGQDSSYNLYQDTAWVNINQTLSIDSLICRPEIITLSNCEESAFSIIGIHNDSLYVNLSESFGIQYSVLDTTVARISSSYHVAGVSEGNTCLLVTYNQDSSLIPIVVKPNYIALSGDSAYCAGDPGVQLMVTNPVLGKSYFLFRDQQLIAGPITSDEDTIYFGIYSLPGEYTSSSFDSLSQCTNSYSSTINLTVSPLPIVNLGNDTLLILGDTIHLDAGNPGFITRWSDNDWRLLKSVDTGGIYWVRVVDPHGCSATDTVIIQMAYPAEEIYGTIRYHNDQQSFLPGASVTFREASGVVYSAITDANGTYRIVAPMSGQYVIEITLSDSWGAVDSLDIIGIMNNFVDHQQFDALNVKAADVNASGYINAVDALQIAKRINLHVDSFLIKDLVYDSLMLFLSPNQSCNLDITVLWAGDVDGSYEPSILWACGDTLTDTRDGQQYPTVQIGTQCWMAKNLNIGVMVTDHYTGNLHTHCSNNGIIEKYCYNNDPANCATYGGLYDWNEMMGYTTTPGTQGICPTGWHIPTDAEWCTLTTFLDATVNCNTWGWSGTNAGGKMKATGTTHWNSPNTGATNSSGFTALGAGGRGSNGVFGNLGDYALFWSSSEYSSTYGVRRYLGYDNASVYRGTSYRTGGFSVRCLRNN